MKRSLIWICLIVACHAGAQNRTVGLYKNDSTAFNGYALFTSDRTTYLIDNCGHEVRRWLSNYFPGNSVYLLENGYLLRPCRVGGSFTGGGIGGRIELFNWEGDLVWAWQYANDQVHQHHDVAPLPNGNILVPAWERKTNAEAIALGRKPNTVPANGLWPDHVVEIKPIGSDSAQIVWEWHLWDHLVQDHDPGKPNYGSPADHPELLNINVGTINVSDWVHINAVSYNPELDQIALSSRSLSEIWIIDHSTTTAEAAGHSGGLRQKGGDFLYRWGNPQVYDRGTAANQRFYGQHDVRWITTPHPWAGKLMVFNNGAGRPGGNFSSVDVWSPPLNAQGGYELNNSGPFAPQAAEWSYQASGFYSPNISGAHPLSNSHFLVCEGDRGRFFEIDTLGKMSWDYINPVSLNGPVTQGQTPLNNSTFRVTRYAPDYPAFVGKDMTPGALIEKNPLPDDCAIYNSVVSVDKNPTNSPALGVRGNPFSDVLLLDNHTGESISLLLTDALGSILLNQTFEGTRIALNTGSWPSGLLVLRAFTPKQTKPFVFTLTKL
ncbi:MAG: aryl-sulfate sulfotransferase [Saprospiraceae bacterium]